MSEASWDRQVQGESSLWYSRFQLYLQSGPERSVDGAYRLHISRQQAGSAAVALKGRAPGAWFAACSRFFWVSRSAEFDLYQAKLVTRAHAQAVRKAQEKHLAVVQNHFGKLIKQLTLVDYSAVTDPGALLRYTRDLIVLERLLLNLPLQVEEVRRAPTDPLVTQAIKESASTESCATSANLAEVCRILSDVGALGDDRESA
jgi:hypothetical protein